MSFNFKEVEVPQPEKGYVTPGMWIMAPVKAELVENEGKTPYLAILFEGQHGKLVEKFYLSEKAMKRIQYFHVALYGKKLEKDFNTASELEKYFNTLFTKKRVELPLLVGGTENNGRIYANLPYLEFVINNEMFEEGPFEENTARYKSVVKRQAAPKSTSVVVNNEDDDDGLMPWD